VSILSSVPGTPEISSAALSSVGSSGKALTTGFGADEIGESAKRTSFFTKAFTAVNSASQQVVLVDDAADVVGFPDVGASVSSAIQGATGSVPQVIDVPYRSNGPALSQLSGKTVSGDMVDALKALKPPVDSTAPPGSSVVPIEGASNVDTRTNVVASYSEARG
jgi:hypothetical protein